MSKSSTKNLALDAEPSHIDFHGQLLVTFSLDGEPYVAMKPIVEGMGLTWDSQFRRIKRNPILSQSVAIMAIPSTGGSQETLALPLKLLNGWLFGVDTSRVKDSRIRETILLYQRECFDVLHRYWHSPSSTPSANSLPPPPINPEPLAPFSHSRVLLTLENGAVVDSRPLGPHDRVLDPADSDGVLRFFREVRGDLLHKVVGDGMTRLYVGDHAQPSRPGAMEHAADLLDALAERLRGLA